MSRIDQPGPEMATTRPHGRRLTPGERGQILELALAGVAVSQIAVQFQVSGQSIYVLLRSNGVFNDKYRHARFRLSDSRMKILEGAAKARNISCQELIGRVIHAASDGMIDALLDDGVTP